MEAYGALLSNVAKTVDQFMGTTSPTTRHVTGWHSATRPTSTSKRTATPRSSRSGRPISPSPTSRPTWALKEDVDLSDDTAEETLVPAARRKLAENRHSMLATMVLMGINRIVITSGRIRAQMGFRINSSDTGQVHTATEFDEKNEASTSFGGGVASWFGGPSAEVKNTLTM